MSKAICFNCRLSICNSIGLTYLVSPYKNNVTVNDTGLLYFAGAIGLAPLLTFIWSRPEELMVRVRRNIGIVGTGFMFSEEPVVRVVGALCGGVAILAESYRLAKKHNLLEEQKEENVLNDLTDGEIENNKL